MELEIHALRLLSCWNLRDFSEIADENVRKYGPKRRILWKKKNVGSTIAKEETTGNIVKKEISIIETEYEKLLNTIEESKVVLDKLWMIFETWAWLILNRNLS